MRIPPSIGTRNQATREAWLEKALASIPAGSRILDAGAGELQYKRFCKHLEYVAQDFGRYDGRGNGEALQMGKWDQARLDIVSDITSIPEPNSSFDAVMCVEVFEHVPDPLRALDEFARLLRPGGHLIITAPFCSLTHFAPFHFYSGFNRYFYEHHLPQRGFEIVDLQPNGNFWEFLAQELRRARSLAKSTGVSLGPAALGATLLLLRAFERSSKNGAPTHGLLHFGWHVHSVKVGRSS
jgi:SAM-dependent methyltransferase